MVWIIAKNGNTVFYPAVFKKAGLPDAAQATAAHLPFQPARF